MTTDALGATMARLVETRRPLLTFPRRMATLRPAITPLVATVRLLALRPGDQEDFVAKTLCDRILAAVAVLLLLPLLMLIAVAIRLDSPGPVIFRQRRHGRHGCEFMVLKFRTMAWNRDPRAGDGRAQTRRGDCRVTRVGDFLRKTSLDELPQLFNVLNGSMSLVGPRPHPVAMRTEDRLGEEIIADYGLRHLVKPGITGWAQINGHRGATDTVEQLRRRVQHDLYYIEHRSFLFDLWIMLLTPVSIVFNRDNAF